MTILLPVLGIMSVTSEWSQRTAMVTFTLEPSRGRFLAAKFVSALIVALVAVVIGLALTLVANGLYAAFADNTVTWELGPFRIFCYFLLHVFGMSTGFAFGALFLSTPVAIVVYFVYGFIITSLFELGAALLDWFEDIRPWVDFSFSQNPIIEADVSGEQWAQLATSGAIWLLLPLAIGVVAGAPGRGQVSPASDPRSLGSRHDRHPAARTAVPTTSSARSPSPATGSTTPPARCWSSSAGPACCAPRPPPRACRAGARARASAG